MWITVPYNVCTPVQKYMILEIRVISCVAGRVKKKGKAEAFKRKYIIFLWWKRVKFWFRWGTFISQGIRNWRKFQICTWKFVVILQYEGFPQWKCVCFLLVIHIGHENKRKKGFMLVLWKIKRPGFFSRFYCYLHCMYETQQAHAKKSLLNLNCIPTTTTTCMHACITLHLTFLLFPSERCHSPHFSTTITANIITSAFTIMPEQKKMCESHQSRQLLAASSI